MGSMILPKFKGASNNIPIDGEPPPDIAKFGYLRKLKTMKKKYLVLRLDSEAGPARLEYYDNEKKYRNGQAPKRSIVLKKCFNINRKMDSKHKFALALYTRDDCFALVAENESEMDDWLGALLKLQQGDSDWDGEPQPKPNFEHVWQVNVKNRGLASTCNITGPHHLCLTSQTLSLVKMSTEKEEPLVFPLMSIRRCGHSDCFFFMELGRYAITGCGELWMATEDNIIAQNMHETILGAMKSKRKDEDLGPISRPRSASTSENNKSGGATARPVALVTPQMTPCNSVSSMTGSLSLKDQPFRSRTVSEGHRDLGATRENHGIFDPLRPHSTAYTHSISYSPPMATNPLSPGSGAYSDSAGSSLSIDDYENDYHPNRIYPYPQDGSLHTEPTITEEPSDDYLPMSPGELDQVDQGLCEIGSASSHETAGADYMRMSYGGRGSHPGNQFQGTEANNRKQMYLSLSSQQTDSCPTSPTTDYIEMASPSSVHQESAGEGYIPMSPVGSLSVELGINVHNNNNKRSQGSIASAESTSSVHHGSLPVETFNGYVPMAPVRENDGYMDMSALSSSLPKSTPPAVSSSSGMRNNLSSPSRSSHSLQDISFGSPSSTGGVEEYHLDKVKSFFPPSEDDSDVYIKPARAYSIGSRPQMQKSHLAAHLEPSRVRAYSFGSQVSSRRRETSTNGGIEAELGTLRNIDARNKKSSSAPLLPSGTVQTPTSTATPPLPSAAASRPARPSTGRSNGNSHNEDLMEIEYTQPAYVRMKGDEHSSRRYSIGSHWQRSNNRSGHDTKPKDDRRSQGKGEGSEHTDVASRNRRSENDYMDMPRGARNSREEQPDMYKNFKDNAVRKPQRKQETEDASKGAHQMAGGTKGSLSLNSENCSVKKTDESDVIGHKKTSSKGHHTKKSTRQKSECSDYMDMGGGGEGAGGSPSSSLKRSSYSLDSSQLYSSNLAGDYVNLDMSCQQSTAAPVKPVVEAVSVQDHDYINLQPGSLPPAYELLPPAPVEAAIGPCPSTQSNKATNTELPLDMSPHLIRQFSAPSVAALLESSPSAARKSSCPVPTANDNNKVLERKKNSRRLSHSPEQITTSDSEASGSRRSLVEGAYENIQLGASRQVSVDRQLNYASLDLAPTSSSEEIVPRSPRVLKVPGAEGEMPLAYAEIDFTKSEGLRNTSGSLREGRV